MIPEEKQKSGNEVNKKKKKRTIERIQHKINNKQKQKEREREKEEQKGKLSGTELLSDELEDTGEHVFGVYGFWVIAPTRIGSRSWEVIRIIV